MSNFAERLKELREEKGLFQSQLSSELKISQSSITRWETGKRVPDINEAIKIAKYFDVPTDYLFGLID